MASTNRVVLDLELGRGFGYGLADIRISGYQVAVTWSDTEGFTHWGGGNGRQLLDYLLGHAEIVGFNLLGYDHQVLSGYLAQGAPAQERRIAEELTEKTLDLHALLLQVTGRRYSLETVARNTLGAGKLEPPEDGDPGLLADYCERDVELTRDLDDYRRTYGVLYVSAWQSVMLPAGKVERDGSAYRV